MFYYDTVLVKQANLEKGSWDLILLGVFQGVRFSSYVKSQIRHSVGLFML